MSQIQLQNPTELDIHRSETVQKLPGFTMVFNGTTGQQHTSFTHHGGANITYTAHATSEFNPNNKQSLTQGDTFEDVKGNHVEVVRKNLDLRSFGDFTVITGSPNFLNSPLAAKYIEHRAEVAAAQVAPELTLPGQGNNTKSQYQQKGEINKETGSTQGGDFEPNPIKDSLPELIEQKQKEMTPIEQQMGVGGNIRLMSMKNLHLQAGTVPTTFDSAFINPIGRSVKKETQVEIKDKPYSLEYKQAEVAVPQVEVKNTAANMPFGDISFIGMNGIQMTGGAGGISMQSAGTMTFGGSSITSIHGAQVIIGGSTAIRGSIIEIDGQSQVNISAPSTHLDTKLTVSKDTVIEGNLIVKGDIRCSGSIYCAGDLVVSNSITADNGNIIAKAADVIAKSISLINHKHRARGETAITSSSVA
jgi:hypothetical protein